MKLLYKPYIPYGGGYGIPIWGMVYTTHGGDLGDGLWNCFTHVNGLWDNPRVLKNSAYQKGADAESDRQPMHWNAFFLKEHWLSSVGVLRSCFLTSA